MSATPPPPSRLPEIGQVTLRDLWAALRAGIWDFRQAPLYGLVFSAVYVLAGLLLVRLGAGTISWTLTVTLGFPLVAPFAAVGLYEVSRRIEAGMPCGWGPVLGVVWAERTRQVPWLGAIIAIYFLFWTFLAHMIFAVFMGRAVLTNISSSYEVFLTPNGMILVAVELGTGAVLGFLLFSMTVVSFPLLLEKEVDFVSAMLLSIRTVAHNLPVMIVWAFCIATGLVLALLPYFLGLFVALPVFGHATWHLYRRALYDPV